MNTPETKPAWYTTEFWLTIFTTIFTVGDMTGVWNALPDRYAAILMAVVTAAYAISRGQAKQGVPYVPPVDTTRR